MSNQIELYTDEPQFTDVHYAEVKEENKHVEYKRLALVCAIANSWIVTAILVFACAMCFRESSVLSFSGGVRFSWMVIFTVVYTVFVNWTLVLLLHKDKKLN
jgi:hypothetical protein